MKKLLSIILLLLLSSISYSQEMKFNCLESHTFNNETKQYDYQDMFRDEITLNIEQDKITYYSAGMDEQMTWTITEKVEKENGSTSYKCTDDEKEITVIINPDYPGVIYAFGDIKNYLMNCKE